MTDLQQKQIEVAKELKRLLGAENAEHRLVVISVEAGCHGVPTGSYNAGENIFPGLHADDPDTSRWNTAYQYTVVDDDIDLFAIDYKKEKIGPWFPIKDGDPWGAVAILQRMGGDDEMWVLFDTRAGREAVIKYHAMHKDGLWELAENYRILKCAQLKPELFQKAMEYEQ